MDRSITGSASAPDGAGPLTKRDRAIALVSEALSLLDELGEATAALDLNSALEHLGCPGRAPPAMLGYFDADAEDLSDRSASSGSIHTGTQAAK